MHLVLYKPPFLFYIPLGLYGMGESCTRTKGSYGFLDEAQLFFFFLRSFSFCNILLFLPTFSVGLNYLGDADAPFEWTVQHFTRLATGTVVSQLGLLVSAGGMSYSRNDVNWGFVVFLPSCFLRCWCGPQASTGGAPSGPCEFL
jgi:hypothetical protein